MTSTVRSSPASEVMLVSTLPALQLIYDTAPIGLACLSPDCRYLLINQRLTEICGISIEGHLGRTVRDCVPALADSVGLRPCLTSCSERLRSWSLVIQPFLRSGATAACTMKKVVRSISTGMVTGW